MHVHTSREYTYSNAEPGSEINAVVNGVGGGDNVHSPLLTFLVARIPPLYHQSTAS